MEELIALDQILTQLHAMIRNAVKGLSIFYIYKRLRPRKKIRNRKKKEQQKRFINEKLITKPLKFNKMWGVGLG
jgi:hypothetical protein